MKRILIIFTLLSIVFSGCTKRRSGAGSGSSLSAEQGNSPGGGLLNQILAGTLGVENKPTWPTPPRVAAVLTSEKEVLHTFTIKLSKSLTPAFEAEGKVDTTFRLKLRSSAYAVAQKEEKYNDKAPPAGNPKGYVNDIFTEVAKGVVVANTWGGTRREMVYFCNYSLTHEEAEEFSGKLFVLVAGVAEARKSLKLVEQSSMEEFRRILPNQSLSDLGAICEKEFCEKGIDKQFYRELQTNIKDVFIYSPHSSCLVDEDCQKPRTGGLPSVLEHTVGRCVDHGNKVLACKNMGLEGASCPVYTVSKGKDDGIIFHKTLASRGSFEYDCDRGLECVIKDPGYVLFQSTDKRVASYFSEVRLKPAKAICEAPKKKNL